MKKRIAMLVTIAMLLSLVPMAATAASTNSMDRVVTVSGDADLALLMNTPILSIRDTAGSFTGQNEIFRLELPATAEWNSPVVNISGGASSIVDVDEITSRILQIEAIMETDAVLTVVLNVKLNNASGEQRVAINRLDSVLTADSHTFAIAEVGQTVTTVTMDNMYGFDFEQVGSIIIEETVKGTVTGQQEFRLRLPAGFEWNPAHETPVNITLGGFLHNETSVEADLEVVLSNNNRDMTVRFVAFEGPTQRGRIVILPSISATSSAAFGDVAVSLTGQNDISSASGLVIADYKEATYTVTSETEDDEFMTGLADGYTATINIKESVKDTLIKGRYVEVDLPSWVKVVNGTNVKIDINNIAMGGTDTSSFRFMLLANPNWMDGDRFDFDLTFEFVISGVAAIDGSQEMPVTIVGAGLNEEVSIGTAVAAITVEVEDAESTYLQAGLQNQAAPDIIIRENFPGALRVGDLKLDAVGLFANSVRFESFDMEVLSGDIVLGSKTAENDAFWFRVSGSSDVASEIRLYNIEVTMDRTVPDGEFDMDVKGSSVLDDLNFAHDNLPERVFRIDPYFMVGVATVGPTNTVAFTIGSNAYTVNGQLMQMDVAPYIQSDRMMIPVRYLEDLFGSKPVWNAEERSVSIEYAGQIFEMTIGSPILTANGIPILELDVSAEITGDRTFVPASRFARAMGVTYTYDEETRTATFN